ncbi:unnamed protein product [Rhizophagus irregularis]|uniref:Uncharacterized protein n=1 Tax=Rhizophagus irregularis TaxID=588596 RepID=A0A916DZA1_9GLOM|nr:unnamed protein product [Rhizophagus irregularis]
MLINNECNKELEKLEDQKQDLSCKLYAAAITIGITAFVIGGYTKWIGKAAIYATGATSTAVMYNACSTRSKLQNSIEKHTSILEQLQSAYKELRNWKILGKRYIQKDIDDMNNNKMTLIDEFVRIRSQCKCLGEIFNSLDDDKK